MRFKIKLWKTENEVGSNMKSTIKYTFVAPGAIGEGRGRGFKSLGKKGNIPTKSLLLRSSDVLKQYINEIETSSMGKDQGQGLKKSIMSNSQGMQVIHKNSMASKKEHIEINTSSPTCINQVKINTPKKLKHVHLILQRLKEFEEATRIRGKLLVHSPGSYFSTSYDICPGIIYGVLSSTTRMICKLFVVTFTTEFSLFLQSRGYLASARSSGIATNRAKLKMLHHIGRKPIREIIYHKAQLEEMGQADPSLPTIEIVEKCCGSQTCSMYLDLGVE